MKVTYISKGKYRADFYDCDGKRCRPVLEAPNKKEAERQALRLSKTVYEPPEKPIKGLTLRAALSRLHNVRYSRTKNGRKVAAIMSQLEDAFGRDTAVKAIDTSSIEGVVHQWQEAGLSAGTINRKLAVLNVLFKSLVEHGELRQAPFVRKLKESVGRTRVLSTGEELALLSSSSHQYKELWKVLIDTGMRLGEVLGMQRQPFDKSLADRRAGEGLYAASETDGERVHIWDSKGGKPRTVPLTQSVQNIIKRRLGIYDQLLFPYSHQQVRQAWDTTKRMIGQADDSQFVPHCLRHTCATRLYERTGDIYLVKEWLGHSSVLTTQRYAHMSTDKLKAGLQALEADQKFARFGHSEPRVVPIRK